MALRLRTFLLIVVAGLCPTESARAIYLHVPLSVHIDTSTCIVVARLIDPRSDEPLTGTRWMTRTLKVESIVWSFKETGTSLRLEWRSRRASEDRYLSLAGERVLWLLKPNGDGSLGIDHPGRAISLEDPAEIEHHLRELRETRDPSPRTRLVARYLESQLPFRSGLQPR